MKADEFKLVKPEDKLVALRELKHRTLRKQPSTFMKGSTYKVEKVQTVEGITHAWLRNEQGKLHEVTSDGWLSLFQLRKAKITQALEEETAKNILEAI